MAKYRGKKLKPSQESEDLSLYLCQLGDILPHLPGTVYSDFTKDFGLPAFILGAKKFRCIYKQAKNRRSD